MPAKRSAPSSSPTYITPLSAGTFLFSASQDGIGRELWLSDGTAAGTVLVKDLNTLSAGASGLPTYLTAWSEPPCQAGRRLMAEARRL